MQYFVTDYAGGIKGKDNRGSLHKMPRKGFASKSGQKLFLYIEWVVGVGEIGHISSMKYFKKIFV